MTEVPKKGIGWKNPPLNNFNSSNETRKLFDTSSYSFDEIFIGNGMEGVNHTTTFSDRYGKVFILQPDLGAITTDQDTTLEIKLNPSLNFFMVKTNADLISRLI